MIARKRSQYSRFFIFTAASALLVSGIVSSRLESTFQLFTQNSGISADFSGLSQLIKSELRFRQVDASELKDAEEKIEKRVLQSRGLVLFESPVLVPLNAVREIHGPDPYRWVRVRFDQNLGGISAARSTKNWVRVSLAKKIALPRPASVRGEIRKLNREVESLKLARLHTQVEKRMSTQPVGTQQDEIQNDSSSTIKPIEYKKEIPIVEAEPIETAPFLQEPVPPVQILTEEKTLGLDEVPTFVQKPKLKPKTSVGLNTQTEVKPSVVKTIHDSLVTLLTKKEAKTPFKRDVTIQYEAVEESLSHLEDLDNHVQTIEYSDLPADKTTKLSEVIRVEREEKAAQETLEVKTATTVALAQTSADDKAELTSEDEPAGEAEIVVTEDKSNETGPVLVSGFNNVIQVSQSSVSVTSRTPAIEDLVAKVNRLRTLPPSEPKNPETPKKAAVDKQGVTQPVKDVQHVDALNKSEEEVKEDTLSPEPKTIDEISVSQSVTTEASEFKKTCDTALIGQEAFSTGASPDELISVCRRVLSLEGSLQGNGSRWWEVRESVNHWPTLIRQKPDSALKKNDRIPILSLNTVKILSTLSKAQTQSKSAGIIVGEVPPGIQVSLSGRSEPIIYFNSRLQIVNSQDTKSARYFTFLNVEPGLPLLNVTLKSGNGSGTIALMVQSGATTYIRVPSPRLRKITGTAYGANSSKPVPVVKANIQVVGQSGKQAVTDKRGGFELNNVLTFDDHPLFLDISSGSREFRHRYRISPEGSKDVVLFRFDSTQVSHWIQQLEGGVSPMSGLIVGALPGLLNSKEAKSEIDVKIGTLDRKNVLRPEVYGLGVGDTLQDTNQIKTNATRFLSVQIPEGPNVPSAFDSKGNMIWSEIVFAQPGVINVVAQ